MKETIVKLHFTAGNQCNSFAGLASAVSADCAYIQHASMNMAERHYIVNIVGTSFSELKEIIKQEFSYHDIDIDEIEPTLTAPTTNTARMI
jgi:hypothetical protein